MNLTEETVDEISALSRLSLLPEEKAAVQQELKNILQYMDVLGELETAGVEPMSCVLPLKNVMREDRVVPSQDRAELLNHAPASDQETFLTPKSVE